jgi:predicted AAA+ superfamily ATPase
VNENLRQISGSRFHGLGAGPRQYGKTTLARQISEKYDSTYFELDEPQTPLRPEIAPLTFKDLRGLVVIDEFQRQPLALPTFTFKFL